MRIAFDIDGTLDRFAVATLCSAVLDKPEHKVFFLTGTLGRTDWGRVRLNRMQQLWYFKIGFSVGQEIDNLFIMAGADLDEVAKMKGKFCETHGIDLFIDDNPDYIAQVRLQSPKTVCLRVMP